MKDTQGCPLVGDTAHENIKRDGFVGATLHLVQGFPGHNNIFNEEYCEDRENAALAFDEPDVCHLIVPDAKDGEIVAVTEPFHARVDEWDS